jgi:arabinosaccharide transport system permease protein
MRTASYFRTYRLVPYVFVLPFIISFCAFYAYPLVSTVIMSFQKIIPGQTHFVGLENYRKMISEDFWQALKVSFEYTVITILILIPGPTLLAALLNSGLKKLNAIYRAAFFIPSLVSVVVAGTIFRLMFSLTGRAVVNASLGFLFGVKPIDWVMGGAWQAMLLMVMLATWRWTGVNTVYFMSGLQSISTDLYEAASIDGAGPARQFLSITMPLLKPTIIFVTTISIFGGFAMFEESYMLWQGVSPNNVGLTLVGLIYQKGFQLGDLGLASAVGLVVMLVVFVLAIIQLNLFGFFRKED